MDQMKGEVGGHIGRKSSLCRFYVRGLCIFQREQCQFAHGIQDLCYSKWQEGDIIQTDYLQDSQFCQKEAKKGPRIYINLYQFQLQPKKYTLEELNYTRPTRVEVRNQMHQKMFLQFMELLEKEYPDANLTEQILMREYTRVGFNKLMTRIKFTHLTSVLCDSDNSRYYKKSMIMPPRIKQETTFIFKKASNQHILNFYRSEYRRILEEQQGQIEQTEIKKMLYRVIYPDYGIPPVNLVMKEKKMNFSQFLSILNGGDLEFLTNKVRAQLSQEQISDICQTYMKEEVNRLLNWKDLYDYLSKRHKINNANTINQVKLILIHRGYRFYYFPMIQFIYHHDLIRHFEEQAQVCTCQYQQPYEEKEFLYLQEFKQQIEEHRIKQQQEAESSSPVIQIFDSKTLRKWSKSLLESKIVGIDLQGKLRKNGYVQLIQINNGQYIFLLDIYQMEKNKDEQALVLAKKILRNILVNPKIVKVFHDCRHDSLALHQYMQTCIINVLDTSTFQTYRIQKDQYSALINGTQQSKEMRLTLAKDIVNECMNVKTVGLNEILKVYKAKHGLNMNKDRFHKMWAQGQVEYFCQRPMHEDYKEYCVKDVLDLPEIFEKMKESCQGVDLSICKHISSYYVSNGHQLSK